MNKTVLRAIFDEMVDKLQSDSSIDREEVNNDVLDYWIEFLEAGFGADKVTEMMSPIDVYRHYDTLVSCGATIDPTELALTMIFNNAGEYVEDNLAFFRNRGADIDTIVADSFVVTDMSDLLKLLDSGISTQIALKISGDLLSVMAENPDDLREYFSIMHDYGLPLSAIQEWVEKNSTIYIVEDIVENEGRWEKFGIKADQYIDRYLNCNEWLIIEELNRLPETISPERFLDHIALETVIDTDSYIFDKFLDDYLEAGGKLNKLVDKLESEIGYIPDVKYIGAMFDIAWKDISAIDLEKFVIACNTCNDMTREARKIFYEELSRRGADEVVLRKLNF